MRLAIPYGKAAARLFPSCLILVAILACVPRAHAQDPFGGIAIGAGLADLGNKVETAVQEAVGGGLLLEVQAGGEVALAIQQAQSAYAHEAALTFTQLNATEQQSLNSLASVANAFLNKTDTDMADIEARAEAVIHDLPFSKTYPQAWGFSPTHISTSIQAPITYAVTGDFYDIGRKGYDATLMMNGKNYTNSAKNVDSLAFTLPISDFLSDPVKVVDNAITVSVPYAKSFLLFFHKKAFATYKAQVASLPASIGDLNFTFTAIQDGMITQTVINPTEFIQESNDDDIKCGGEHADQAIHIAYPTTDIDPVLNTPRTWSVIPSSVNWLVDWSQGTQGTDQDWWLAANCSTVQEACLCVSTEHHRFGTSGKVHFKIQYAEQALTAHQTVTNVPLHMGWGESRVVQIPTDATWTATYTRFDGHTNQFATPYTDEFIQVSESANILTITTAPFVPVDSMALQKAVAQRRAARGAPVPVPPPAK